MITTVLYFKANNVKEKLHVNLRQNQSMFVGANFTCCRGLHWKVFALDTQIGPNNVIIKVFIDNTN